MPSGLPHPRQLAALGPVLCLYRSQAGGELSGWAQAACGRCESVLDSDGLCQNMQFFDDEGRCCWRLYLLPDTDFLAWEQLVEALPECCAAEPEPGLGERLWLRLAGRLGGPAWRASVLRLHALPGGAGGAGVPLLAASLPRLSVCGTEFACRIACREGADCSTLADVHYGGMPAGA
ncbi:Hemin transport protein [Thermomonas sp.]|uniref:Hemin transport protein n=1 Tax=Thermomonas sp. TaxID=1971895 RepID=UPI00260A4D12|nr:Hemin transport protein [Thermomonas sp.]